MGNKLGTIVDLQIQNVKLGLLSSVGLLQQRFPNAATPFLVMVFM
jgi:hypothetical protein